MEAYSKRFQSARLYSRSSKVLQQPNLDRFSKSTSENFQTKFNKKLPPLPPPPPQPTSQKKSKQKQSFFSQQKCREGFLRLWYSCIHCIAFLCVFYDVFVTCFRIITKYLQNIICQNPEEQLIHDDDTPPPAKEITTVVNNPASTSGQLYSSDSDSDNGEIYAAWKSSTTVNHQYGGDICYLGNDTTENVKVDDYELFGVRFIDNVIYFLNLYCVNYPAFVQEISHNIRKWTFPPQEGKGTAVTYGHNLNPTRKRPSIVKKGIEFWKRRKLKQKMSRVYGDAHKGWLLKIALLSRLLIFVMQFIAVNLPSFFKHNNDGFKFTHEETYGKLFDLSVNTTFGGFVNWDAHYFLHISVYGYTSENFLAFFPLLPMLLFLPSRILYFVFGTAISLSSIVIVLGVTFNIWLFLKCMDNIYEITKYRAGASTQLITTACIIFCFNPASIFFSGLYTETLFAYLTSSVILSLLRREHGFALFYAAMSCLCRSNGVLNVGFILAIELQYELQRKLSVTKLLAFAFKCIVKFSISLIPFLLFQTYGVITFCSKGKIYHDPSDVPLYCVDDQLSFKSLPYFYIQKKYWNVGFLEYFQIKQIPNFILAAPVLYLLATHSWMTLKISAFQILDKMDVQYIYPLFHAVHGLFLAAFCLLFVHVQVSTRMIMAACPYLYQYLATSHEDEVELFRNRKTSVPAKSLALTIWCILYYIIGTVLFSLGLPWT